MEFLLSCCINFPEKNKNKTSLPQYFVQPFHYKEKLSIDNIKYE